MPAVVAKKAIGSMTSHENSQNVSRKKRPIWTIRNPNPNQSMRRTCLWASISISCFFSCSCFNSSLLGSFSGVKARGTALLIRSTTYGKQTNMMSIQFFRILTVSTNYCVSVNWQRTWTLNLGSRLITSSKALHGHDFNTKSLKHDIDDFLYFFLKNILRKC